MIGTTELLLVGGLALLLFGGKKLPEMMRGLGQGVREFKKGVNTDAPLDEENLENQENPETAEKSESPELPAPTESPKQ
ncbi:MAG: twin-arginine translocase TatA/TatE family subunit [Muribaculaceae bacterium]|nr:twin-arginine translocase TatA/TatE family subunit [Muribaculaceae bacterium]